MTFIWRNLPVFFIWFIGLSTLNNALHNISPPVESVRTLSFLPLVCTLFLLWFSIRRESGNMQDDVRARRRFFAWGAGLVLLYLTPLVHDSLIPLSLKTQKHIYEASALIQFVILVIHGRTWLRAHDWIWVFGVTLLFGMILENGGIIMGVFTEPRYLLYVPMLPAPLATALGWVNVMYCAFFSIEKLLPQMGSIQKGLVCAFIGLSLDLPFDPVATRLGWWVWDPSLQSKLWDVPVINFIAWFWALFPYGTAYYWVRQRKNYRERRKILLLVGSFPVILMVEFLGVLASLSLAGDREGLLIFKRFFSSVGLM